MNGGPRGSSRGPRKSSRGPPGLRGRAEDHERVGDPGSRTEATRVEQKTSSWRLAAGRKGRTGDCGGRAEDQERVGQMTTGVTGGPHVSERRAARVEQRTIGVRTGGHRSWTEGPKAINVETEDGGSRTGAAKIEQRPRELRIAGVERESSRGPRESSRKSREPC